MISEEARLHRAAVFIPGGQASYREYQKITHTFLGRVNGGYGTERSFPLVVVDPDLHMEGWERLDALIFEDIFGGFSWRDSCLHPSCRSMGPEGHHVAEAWPILQLLWNRLNETIKKLHLVTEINKIESGQIQPKKSRKLCKTENLKSVKRGFLFNPF